ncbi:GNAT family N-acetyltransferase [Streptomyces sp. NPDC017529]|uniref:GNAT family N-acetyltransferase n=1 Tax=Streptomyces sp. NPDC017529 TaxID=3365000 RepID=UPI00379CD01F
MEFTTGGRLEVHITRADVGKRVSVRRLTGAGQGGAKFTDTVGVLTSWDDGVLSITRRNGEVVRIGETALVAGKAVPAAPARRRSPATSAPELDRVAARGWPPVESEWLGEWQLRASAGFTRRANSVAALGDPGLPLDTALRRVRAWYAERSLPVYIQVSTGAPGTQEALAAELAGRGWTREVTAETRIAALAPVGDLDADVSRVVLGRRVDDGWLRRYRRSARPGPEVLKVLHGGPSVWFASVPDEAGGVAAIGRCVVDGRWAGFAAVEVGAEHRRRGLASAVMAALARKALDEGASAAYLQVETDNDGARALYDGLGFVTHHHYHHWRPAQGGPS